MAKYDLESIEKQIGKFFDQFPPLPENILNLIVIYGPYFVLISGVLGLASLLSLLNIGFQPVFLMNPSFGVNYYLSLIFSIIISVIFLLSFKPLLKKELKGWRLVFYGLLLSLLPSIIIFSIGNLIVLTIAFYLLFKIKKSYH
jgi:hypothetical protein